MGQKALILPYGTEEPVFDLPRENIWQEGCIRLLYVGRLVPYKGIDCLIRALSLLRGLSWHLVIAGEGKQKPFLKLLVQDLSLKNRITFLGSISEERKKRLLNSCDIFVYPSLGPQESFGISVAEAFSYRKAVITSRINTALSYLARDGLCGAVSNPGDVRDLAEKISSLILNKDERERAAKRNFHFWQEKLSPRVYLSRYHKILKLLKSNTKANTKIPGRGMEGSKRIFYSFD